MKEYLHKNKKYWLPAVLLVAVEIIIVMMASGRFHKSELFQQDIALDSMILGPDCYDAARDSSQMGINRLGAEIAEEPIVFMCGPYIELAEGSYEVTIRYQTDTDANTFEIYAADAEYLDADYYTDVNGYLPSFQNQVTSKFRLLKDLEDFEVRVFYQGTGSLQVTGIHIQETNGDAGRWTLDVALLLILLDMVILLRRKIAGFFSKENYLYTMGLICLIFFSSILLFVNKIYWGHDLPFHMMRIEGLKEALLSGQFPAKIAGGYMRGYGYATDTLYPELFLYVPAVMRLLGMNLHNAYKTFIIVVNILTVCISFYSFKGIFRDRNIAMVGTILYTLAPYRIVDIYYRAAAGEFCAMIGLPLIAYGLYTFVQAGRDLIEQKDEKEETTPGLTEKAAPNWIALALGYTIIIQSHIITIMFVALFTVIVGLIYIRAFVNKKCLIALVKMSVLLVSLNAWFIVPFVDYYRLDRASFIDDIQKNGAMLAQLFINHVIADVIPGGNQQLRDGLVGEIPLGIGYGLLLSTACFVVFLRERKTYCKLGLTAFALGILSIVLSLHNFPWDAITTEGVVGMLIINVQFPWRFLMLTALFFTITGCVGTILLGDKIGRNNAMVFISVIAILGYTAFTDAYLEKRELTNVSLSELGSFKTGDVSEYMLAGTDITQIEQRGEKITVSSLAITTFDYERRGGKLLLTIHSDDDAEQFVELPLLMYPGYTAEDVMTGEKLVTTYGNNNIVRVMVPAHYQGMVQVAFTGKWYWRVADIITLLTVIILLFGNKIYDVGKKKLVNKTL